MENLNPEHLTVMFLSLGVLLGVARILGELTRRLHQPTILGELLAGVLLGPTILGSMFPEFGTYLFPTEGPNAIALEAISSLAIVLFLMVAGIEVDLSTIWKQGKLGIKIGISSMVAPFFLGFAVAWWLPQMMGRDVDSDALTFALFFATALSISALPIIAKTLMDMGLYRSEFGMVVISAAVLNDLVGWIIFAIILGMMDTGSGHANNIVLTIALTLAFAIAMLTVGRWLIHKVMPFLQAYTQWPGGVLGFALTLALLGSAFTEWIGIHAILGAFLVGVAIGDSSHLRERTRVTIEHFVSFIFAPLFFATIGLKVNFLTHFHAPLVLSVLAIACICKLAGGVLGARWGGMAPRDAWAVGFAMNSRGAMEIILGILALEAGIIHQRLFVALVIMAIVTSMISGPAMRLILRPKGKRRIYEALSADLFLGKLKAGTRRAAIQELVGMASEKTSLPANTLEAAVWAREEALSTGLGNGVAMPHARINGIEESVVAVGISDVGIDFDAPDGKPAHVILLVLTPTRDAGAQIEIAAEIAGMFRDTRLLDSVLQVSNYTAFLALIKTILEDSPEATQTT